MTPESSLVADLAAYDPKLRVRWASHTGNWFIERKLDRRPTGFEHVTPPAEDAPALRRDLWAGWREGWLHVLTVSPELCHWRFIAPELARMDSWRQGSFKAINAQLDADAEAWDAAKDKAIDHWAEGASKDAADHVGWFEKRTVSMHQPEATPYVDSGLGFQVRDRRLVVNDGVSKSG